MFGKKKKKGIVTILCLQQMPQILHWWVWDKEDELTAVSHKCPGISKVQYT